MPVKQRQAAAAKMPSPVTLRLQRDPLRLMLFGLLLISISHVHGYVGLAALRPALLLTVGAAIYTVMNPRQLNDGALLRTWPARVMVGLGLVACISIPFSLSIGGSGSFFLGTYVKVLLIAFLLVVAIRHVRDLYTFVLGYVASCGLLILLSVFVVGISKRQGLTMYDANDIGLVLLVGLPLALAVLQSTSRAKVKVLAIAVLVGIGATLAISSSRGGFVGLVAVGVGLLFLLRHVSVAKRLGFLLVALAGLFIAAPEGYWDTMETILHPTEDYNWQTTYGRRNVAERGLGYMFSNPVTGIGIGQFPRAEGMALNPHAVNWSPDQSRIKWSAAHNSFIQVGAELGIPGLLLFCSLVFGGIVAMMRLRRRLPFFWRTGDPEQRFLYNLALYLPVSLVAFASTGFFVSFAYLDPIYILAALMAGLYAAVDERMRRERAWMDTPAMEQGRPPGWRVVVDSGRSQGPRRPAAARGRGGWPPHPAGGPAARARATGSRPASPG